LSDVEVVCGHHEGEQITGLISLVNGVLDDFRRVLMEVLKCNGRDYTSDARRDTLAGITHEVLD
jgi:hypothetical protein